MKLKIATFNIQHCENYDTEKIDYIFTSRDIKTRKSFVPDGVLSDHLPYVAEIDIAE